MKNANIFYDSCRNNKRESFLLTSVAAILFSVSAINADAQEDTLWQYELKEIDISRKQQPRMEATPRVVEIISSKDLLKDACCNLSESFENSASVDANYTDAVSGARHIRLLGLDGVYTQFTDENIPGIRNLQQTFGLSYVPGPWMSSIQINKGAGSVVNGYESMTGQINIEYKKPQNSERFYGNLYINQDARTELNLQSAYKMGKADEDCGSTDWSGMTLAHGLINLVPMDFNHDEFVDNPLVKQANVMQRFTYLSGKKFNFISAVLATVEDRQSGQLTHSSQGHPEHHLWRMRLQTARANAFAKTGFILNDVSSIGVQYKYAYHQQHGNIGARNYNAREHFGYVNLIYQYEFLERSFLKAGASFQANDVRETLDSFSLNRTEFVPGFFTEVTYDYENKITLIAGVRADYHNLYGPFFVPRINFKWNIIHDVSWRLSAGKGYHVPTIFAEHFGLLASNRTISLPEKIKPETAWNFGSTLSYTFYLDYREGSITVDYFRTQFVNRLVTDLENVRELRFYNLEGKSYSNSVQVEVNYEALPRFDVKLAYKFDDVRTTYRDGLKWEPLRPRHKGLISLEYVLKNERWRFNSHFTWYGIARVPSTEGNEERFRVSERSKNYFLLNAQITYIHKKWFEVYVGAENMLNQTQRNPIIGLDGFDVTAQFDASLIWGPIRGAMAFAGVRFSLK